MNYDEYTRPCSLDCRNASLGCRGSRLTCLHLSQIAQDQNPSRQVLCDKNNIVKGIRTVVVQDSSRSASVSNREDMVAKDAPAKHWMLFLNDSSFFLEVVNSCHLRKSRLAEELNCRSSD